MLRKKALPNGYGVLQKWKSLGVRFECFRRWRRRRGCSGQRQADCWHSRRCHHLLHHQRPQQRPCRYQWLGCRCPYCSGEATRRRRRARGSRDRMETPGPRRRRWFSASRTKWRSRGPLHGLSLSSSSNLETMRLSSLFICTAAALFLHIEYTLSSWHFYMVFTYKVHKVRCFIFFIFLIFGHELWLLAYKNLGTKKIISIGFCLSGGYYFLPYWILAMGHFSFLLFSLMLTSPLIGLDWECY